MFRKYAAALLPAAGILFGALQVILADNIINQVEAGQLIALVAGLVVTFVVPLVGTWEYSGALKVGFAVLAAVATLIVPLALGFSFSALVVFLLAIVNALATQIGVDMRRTPVDARDTNVVTSVL